MTQSFSPWCAGVKERPLRALVECGLAHREISPADGILRYGPVKIECTHERVCARTAAPPSPREEANMSM